MSLTQAEARDEILTRLKAVVDAITTGSRPELVWDDTVDTVPRDKTSKWARVSLRHLDAEQATLANQDGVRRWRRVGVLAVQLFTPLGDGLTLADSVSSTIRGGFEGYSTAGGVWFRRPRTQEVGADGPWFQVNVLVDFEYDEVK